MYIPASFHIKNREKLFSIIKQYNFAVLFSQKDGFPYATHLPFMIDPDRGENGTLIAHFARANKHWKMLEEAQQVLVVFQGPHTYITPHWYENKETVPTWNYAAVHVYGKPILIHDPDRLKGMVTRLTHFHEDQTKSTWDRSKIESTMGVNLKAIVGLEIPVERIEGKFKFNQNRSREDQEGVMSAMFGSDDPGKQHCGHIMKEHLDELEKSKQ